MKKNIILISLILASSLGFSQDKEERIKALKVAMITEKLSFSGDEAQSFWPIYNAFQDSNRAMKNAIHEKRKAIDYATLSEADAKSILKEITILSNKRHDLYNEFISDITKVIPAKKVLLLKEAENEFKHKMFEEYKKRKKTGH
ncbi:sensor of ECF-type sigma factor [Yeosuana sp. MJ-SS3]|uniref:Sensor of ECF-type sigma factor n=1 Tax=Gilvirhabdus luticola TaxID=3079858 RepID=A0ABU3U7T8_9FLAO|nr:sensor of ECF-type sigma factor [Yeosuana sp. MJ-SS3]MDU8886461.1 sensor of ECF-type sigma factor [Yeosuana sp. MJ-SS3]